MYVGPLIFVLPPQGMFEQYHLFKCGLCAACGARSNQIKFISHKYRNNIYTNTACIYL